jgi:hypothetical protein
MTEESMDEKGVMKIMDEKERRTLPKDKRVMHTHR